MTMVAATSFPWAYATLQARSSLRKHGQWSTAICVETVVERLASSLASSARPASRWKSPATVATSAWGSPSPRANFSMGFSSLSSTSDNSGDRNYQPERNGNVVQNNDGSGDRNGDHGSSKTNHNSNRSANTNPSEVNKFSSFASYWWDSRSNPLVGMNPIRVQFLREVVDRFQPPMHLDFIDSETKNSNRYYRCLPFQKKRILDIGCGGGLLTESLSRLGASLVVGLDASLQVVEAAKCHSFHENSRLKAASSPDGNDVTCDVDEVGTGQRIGKIRYIGGTTVEELAVHWRSELEKEKASSLSSHTNVDENHDHDLFDVITALEVIEHVPHPSSLLQSAVSLLKPNGLLFVSTINRTMKSYGLAIVAAEYILGKVPVGTHDWNQFWSPEEVNQMICLSDSAAVDAAMPAMARMKQVAISGMVIQPPFINMHWALNPLDTDVNWIGAYQKQLIQR